MSKEQIAGALREYRKKKGLKATTVGQMIGKSGKTVSGWEHGVGQPDIDTLMKLCAIYGIESFAVFQEPNGEPQNTLTAGSMDVANAYQKAAPPVQDAVRRFLGMEYWG